MARMPAYTGFKAKCPKCRDSNAATAWHEGGSTRQTSRGQDWPCRHWVGPEHLCRECRTCGYAWAETLPPDDGETPGTGAAREYFEREAIAAFESVISAVAALNPELAPQERRRIARMLIKGTEDRVHAGELVIVSLPDQPVHAVYDTGATAALILHSGTVTARKASSNAAGPPDGERLLWGSSARP